MPVHSSWGRPLYSSASLGAAGIISIADLGDWREIKLEIMGLQHNVGTPDLYVQVSSDNGATWIAANYAHAGSTGTAAFIFATSAAAATSYGALITLYDFNVARVTWAEISGGREGSATGARTAHGYNTGATVWNALNVTNSTATAWTANTLVRVYGKA